MKYYIENYNRNESINYKEFRKYFHTYKFLYQLTEENAQTIHHNEQDTFRGNKTFYYLMGQMNKIITNEIAIMLEESNFLENLILLMVRIILLIFFIVR